MAGGVMTVGGCPVKSMAAVARETGSHLPLYPPSDPSSQQRTSASSRFWASAKACSSSTISWHSRSASPRLWAMGRGAGHG